MEEYHITIAGQSKYEIELCAVQCGRDYSVTICGGGRHHVGAAALGCDESGTVGHKMRGATVSVLCVFTGKDDDVENAKTIYGQDFARIKNVDQFADTVGGLIQRQIREMA